MVTGIEISGECDTRFGAVREAFAENFVRHGEVGAAVAVTIDGRPVVDLWAGHADGARTRPWERDTIVNVYSTTKGMTTICAHRLVDQGKLDIDAPVARYWPDFAQAGKADLPVRYLLTHQAGLPAVKEPLPPDALFDWETMTRALAAQEPWWEPGARHGYHALTFGYLVGEVVRRISGKSLGTYFREEVAEPLGIDFHIGLDAVHDSRTAEMIPAPPPPPDQPNMFEEMRKHPDSMQAKAFMNPAGLFGRGTVNSREWRGAEIPAANGHTTARALARVYGALSRGGEVDGVRVLSSESIERATVEQVNGEDALLTLDSRFGLGFMLPGPLAYMGPNPRAFGHPGAGGSLGFADPDAKVGFGYTMNQMFMGAGLADPRWAPLIDAVYEAL